MFSSWILRTFLRSSITNKTVFHNNLALKTRLEVWNVKAHFPLFDKINWISIKRQTQVVDQTISNSGFLQNSECYSFTLGKDSSKILGSNIWNIRKNSQKIFNRVLIKSCILWKPWAYFSRVVGRILTKSLAVSLTRWILNVEQNSHKILSRAIT